MNAPVGGECGGITVNHGNSLREENSYKEMNSCATVIGTEPGSLGVTTTAGSGVLATQQFSPTDWWDLDACEQQLCADFCAGCRHIPNGASNENIKTMATAARRNTPLLMENGIPRARSQDVIRVSGLPNTYLLECSASLGTEFAKTSPMDLLFVQFGYGYPLQSWA